MVDPTGASLDLVLLHGFLVFFMQCGFIMMESGFSRAKSVRNVLLKNCISVCLAAFCWWALGYAFAHGRSKAGGFIGGSRFFQDADTDDRQSKPWFFSWTFAVSSVTIVSGCLAERTQLVAYPALTLLIVCWVHPVAVHWVWSSGGWLQKVSHCRFLDFAGGTVVHCVGGLTGLVGAKLCGPRIGRFEDGQGGRPQPMPGHDVSSVALGTFMLWFGWFGFNCGSIYVYNGAAGGSMVDRVALNMTLSASTAGLTALAVTSIRSGTLDLGTCCNGVLAGLVASTGSSGFVAPWASAVIGLLAGGVYVGLSRLLLRLHIDDPLESSAIHLGGGLLGVLLTAAFARPEYLESLLLYGTDGPAGGACGGFFLSKQGGLQLGMQLLGIVVICAWAGAWALALFSALKFMGRLRVEQATELAGIDNIEHGGPAYPEFNLVPLNH